MFSERDVLRSFGPGNMFVNNTITNSLTPFTEHEIYTALPIDCNVLTGATLKRSDVLDGTQVVLEDLYFADGCKSFTKIVKGQAKPGPLLCKVVCTRDEQF